MNIDVILVLFIIYSGVHISIGIIDLFKYGTSKESVLHSLYSKILFSINIFTLFLYLILGGLNDKYNNRVTYRDGVR